VIFCKICAINSNTIAILYNCKIVAFYCRHNIQYLAFSCIILSKALAMFLKKVIQLSEEEINKTLLALDKEGILSLQKRDELDFITWMKI